MFEYKTIVNTEITRILRNEHIYVFYNRNNIYSFISCYLIYKFFEQAQQLDKFHLVPVLSPSDLYINRYKEYKDLENGNFIFLDCDITRQVITHYISHVKRIIIIDDYQSSYKVAFDYIEKSIYSNENKKKITFIHTENNCSVVSVWRKITSDEMPDPIVQIGLLYKNEKNSTSLSDYDFTASTLINNSFDKVEDYLFTTLKTLKSLKGFYSITHHQYMVMAKICLTNSYALNVLGLKAICVNVDEYNGRVLNYFYKMNNLDLDGDILITYSESEDLTKVIVNTRNNKLNLLELFSKYSPIGNSDKIHFYTRKSFKGIFKK